MKIFLTKEEILNVEEQLRFSRTEIIKNQRKNVYGHPNDLKKAFETQKEGCFYEAAVCKFEGKPYKLQLFGIDTGKYQVRGTKYENGRLILHPKDNDEDIFILVTGIPPEFELVGWIKAIDGKKKEFWIDPSRTNRFAYFVPQDYLQSMEEL